jgi:hypothetical protein
VTPGNWQRTSAFGLLNNASRRDVKRDIHRVLAKARNLSSNNVEALRVRDPINRLRRELAHAMRMDVLFTPRVTRELVNSRWPNSRLPIRQEWSKTPVWKTADSSAYCKANRLCSLLRLVVVSGWKANIVHDLVQLAIWTWQLSKRDFFGVCRRIVSKIRKRSSPDPTERIGAQAVNPIRPDSVRRYRPAKRENVKLPERFPRKGNRPTQLETVLMIVRERQKRLDSKRVKMFSRKRREHS